MPAQLVRSRKCWRSALTRFSYVDDRAVEIPPAGVKLDSNPIRGLENLRPQGGDPRLRPDRAGKSLVVRELLRGGVEAAKKRRLTRVVGIAAERGYSFWTITRSGCLDPDWYRAQRKAARGVVGPVRKSRYGRGIRRVAAAAHYVVRGRTRGLSPHPLFEPEYFDPKNWQRGGLDPFVRYLANRKNWYRPTHPWFDGLKYVERTPDAERSRWGPLGHFMTHATAGSILPAVGGSAGAATLTWAEGLAILSASLADRTAQERLLRTARVSRSYDRAAERWFLGRWRTAELPPAMGEAPLVSVVMAVWNRADRVAAAIVSVQRQSLQDWELLVVDDGSTDDTADLVASLAESDSRITLLRERHHGVSHARNVALGRARGRYVAFLDSDNTYRPDFLRTAVAAMWGNGWRAGYAAMLLTGDDGVRYRAVAGGRKLLELRNHIDLNALVVERALLDEVGGFDESLARSVDYDLVLRLSAVAPIAYLPFVATHYDHGTNPSRLTNREPISWREVAQNNNLIDWRREACATHRVRGRVSVVVSTSQDWLSTERCVRSLLAEATAEDLEIVVVDNASRRSVSLLLAALCAAQPKVRLIRQPINRFPALASNLGFAHSTGETVVFVRNTSAAEPGWLEPLRKALDDPSVLAVQSLQLNSSGSVLSAGLVFPPRATLPVHFLAQHPVEDARRAGAFFEVAALDRGALAMRAADFAAVRGFDPLFRDGLEDVDLTLRLKELRPGRLVVATDSVVIRHDQAGAESVWQPPNEEVFVRRWANRLSRAGGDAEREDLRLWRAAGFSLAHYRVDSTVPGSACGSTRCAPRPSMKPVLTRSPREVTDGPAKGLPALRWALKVAAPSGLVGLSWGDLHFARALAAALVRLGQEVVIDARGAECRDSAYLDDVVLVLRGLLPVTPQPGRVNLLWVISHPDLVHPAEVRAYDAAFAAGDSWARRMSELADTPVETLLQCTDPDRFHPDVAQPDTGEPVLFVGNSRNVFRPSVRDAIAAGVDVAIYGTLWERFVDRRLVRGEYYPNEDVAVAYRSAGIVLNDHWDDMRREGFVSNRLFDATACAARIVSDDLPGLKEIFDGVVRTYQSVDELKDLLTKPKDAVFPSEAERRRVATVVRREHSFDARARALLDAAVHLW